MNTIEEIIANLENYALWDYGGYTLSRSEAKGIIEALKELKERREHEEEVEQ
jgi:hypothetical protein